MWPFFAKHIFSKMKKYTVYSWMVNCVSEKFCLWQSTTISMWTNTKCLFVRSNYFYSTFRILQQYYLFDPCFNSKMLNIFLLGQISCIASISNNWSNHATEAIFYWMLIFSSHCQSDASFFLSKQFTNYQNLFSGWPLWKDKVDTWGNKTCLTIHVYNQHKHKKKTQLFTTTRYWKSR